MKNLRQLVNRIRRIEFPVLRLEMRIRQRKARPFIVMGIYAGVLSVAALVVLFAQGTVNWLWSALGAYSYDPAIMGRLIFRLMSYLQMALVCLIAPAYSAGAIGLERERGTLDMLAVTSLSTSTIVLQKLGGAMAEIAMLLVSSVPVLAIVFMLGGVSPIEVALVYVLILNVAVLLNAAGVFWSALFRNTRTSMFVSYASAMGYIVVLPILASLTDSLVSNSAIEMYVGAVTAYLLVAVLAGGMAALLIFGIAAKVLRRVEAWRTRAFRMGVSGGLYCSMLLLLGVLGITRGIIDWSPSLFELPALMNPFTPLSMFDEYAPDATASLCITLGLAITGTYLFQRFSVTKLDILRRS